MSLACSIRSITPDNQGYDALLEASIAESHNMLVRLRQNWRSGSNRFDRPGEIFLGAFHHDEKLVAVCGRNRDPYSENASTGRVRHLYVIGARRRRGLGSLLLKAIVEDAPQFFSSLNVRAPVEAFSFYESLGFKRIDHIEAATHQLVLSQRRSELDITNEKPD